MRALGRMGNGHKSATFRIGVLLGGLIMGCAIAAAQNAPTPSAPGAEVYFVDIKDGDTVPTKVRVHFGLKNRGVAPAGSDRPNSGHHHLIIDSDLPPLNQPIP